MTQRRARPFDELQPELLLAKRRAWARTLIQLAIAVPAGAAAILVLEPLLP